MAESPERSPYRDASHTSPLTPILTSGLPQWLRHTRTRSGLFSHGRFKVISVATICIIMGWMLTTALGPAAHDVTAADMLSYDVASSAISNSPASYGELRSRPQMQPGILGEDAPEDELGLPPGSTNAKEPSVTGALAELHHAVKGKLQTWSPYYIKPLPVPGNALNRTGSDGSGVLNTTAPDLTGEAVTDGISEDAMLGAKTRIGKCTILFNGNSYWERAIRTHERHDREHGYRLHVLRQHLMDDVWSKPAYILSLLLRELSKPESERLEWLFWVDADTIILNPYIPIDVFLPPAGSQFEDVHLMYSNDWNGLNNGVFPVRVNQWSVKLFSAITSFRHYRPDADLVFRDQSAMDMLMKEPEFANNIVQAPQRWFNAYQGEHNETLAPFQIRRGDILVHFAGVPNREERMGYWLDRAEQHLDDWEVPVKSTSYMQEVKDFWIQQANTRRDKQQLVAEQVSISREMFDKITKALADYGDRLEEETKVELKEKHEALRSRLESVETSADVEKMREAVQGLELAAAPLKEVIDQAQKVMLTSAHEAIFGGEKDLLEGGFNNGVSTPELARISETIKHLKELVMVPQEHWDRQQIAGATNDVTSARAARQEAAAQVAPDSVPGKAAGGAAAPIVNATGPPQQVPTDTGGVMDASDALDAAMVKPVSVSSDTSPQALETSSAAE